MIGQQLGPYQVLSKVGEGGMGQVYRARDTNLNRDVALKVLPDAFFGDPERLARFRREAQILASLNHPNIAIIHGFEDVSASRDSVEVHTHALVMELVEGPTLADRIARGPLALEDASAIARQIADALECAHEQGIIHRDLKPANIKVRADGAVKVLDFGLAKAFAPEGSVAAAVDSSQSPTGTSPVTGEGIILGTAAYMSPEQARARPVDKRTDIWAFGCVLFEMLTGARAFQGADAVETMASILRAEPAWERLPGDTPESIRRLLARCLQKERAKRLADIRDARLEIDEPAAGPARMAVFEGRGRERLFWGGVVGALLVAVVALAVGGSAPEPVAARPETHLDIATPPTTDPVSFALSPDGAHLVYVASANGQPQLWLRSLTTGAVRPMPGTQGASFPFWSPDSRSVAFFSAERLRKVAIDGGPPTAVAFAALGAGGAWNADGTMLFPMVPDSPLFRVNQEGGEPQGVAGFQPPGGERFPQWLPDRRHFLYFVAESRSVFVGDMQSAERRRLFDADAAAVFAPPDQVLFVLDDTLFSQGFDVERLALVGERSRLADGVVVDRSRGVAAVSVSTVGSLVYRTGAFDQRRQLAWVDRQGTVLQNVGEPDLGAPYNPELSPDGRRVAFSRSRGGNTDIWLHELGRDGFSRFTSEPPPEIVPLWSPDGSRVLFARAGGMGLGMFLKTVAENGPDEPLLQTSVPGVPLDWSRNGTVLYRQQNERGGNWDIWALNLTGDRTPSPIVRTPFDDRSAKLSPDGSWMLYESNDSGRYEIYLQPFPRGERSAVSSSGGSQPRWRADGREIFYVTPDGSLMSVPVRRPATAQRLELGKPERLFQAAIDGTVQGGITHAYAPSADGQRFFMTTFVEQSSAPLTIILNRRGQ